MDLDLDNSLTSTNSLKKLKTLEFPEFFYNILEYFFSYKSFQIHHFQFFFARSYTITRDRSKKDLSYQQSYGLFNILSGILI